MSNEAKLGTVPKGNEGRDAVHVAIVPAHAGRPLLPGWRVALDSDGMAIPCEGDAALGVVDPFLQRNGVAAGEWFWLCLFPKTITNLRHVWEHPEFPSTDLVPISPTKALSEKWLQDWIKTADCPGYDDVIAAAVGDPVETLDGYSGPAYEVVAYGDGRSYLHFNGRDAHSEIPPEFWDHVENATGKKCPERATHFSCSC